MKELSEMINHSAAQTVTRILRKISVNTENESYEFELLEEEITIESEKELVEISQSYHNNLLSYFSIL